MEIEKVILVKLNPKTKDDYIKSEHYYIEYKGILAAPKHSKVLNVFFDKIAIHLLSGNVFRCPLGKFWIKRVNLDPNKKYVNLGATKAARKIDKTTTIFYSNNYFFAFAWRKPANKSYENFVFDASYKNVRKIPQYESILELNAI